MASGSNEKNLQHQTGLDRQIREAQIKERQATLDEQKRILAERRGDN